MAIGHEQLKKGFGTAGFRFPPAPMSLPLVAYPYGERAADPMDGRAVRGGYPPDE